MRKTKPWDADAYFNLDEGICHNLFVWQNLYSCQFGIFFFRQPWGKKQIIYINNYFIECTDTVKFQLLNHSRSSWQLAQTASSVNWLSRWETGQVREISFPVLGWIFQASPGLLQLLSPRPSEGVGVAHGMGTQCQCHNVAIAVATAGRSVLRLPDFSESASRLERLSAGSLRDTEIP